MPAPHYQVTGQTLIFAPLQALETESKIRAMEVKRGSFEGEHTASELSESSTTAHTLPPLPPFPPEGPPEQALPGTHLIRPTI